MTGDSRSESSVRTWKTYVYRCAGEYVWQEVHDEPPRLGATLIREGKAYRLLSLHREDPVIVAILERRS
jgi:hypothetical protein